MVRKVVTTLGVLALAASVMFAGSKKVVRPAFKEKMLEIALPDERKAADVVKERSTATPPIPGSMSPSLV